jgi:glycosyltransferase involved in cell wall biosynthesis
MTNPSVGIVMVSMGRINLLRNTLGTLFATSFTGPLVVVEQGVRGAPTRPFLESIGVTSIMLKENHGKGYAWNVGLRFLEEPCAVLKLNRPKYVLLCDDDLCFKPGWEDHMIGHLEAFYGAGLRALSGFRHSSQANAKTHRSGDYSVVEGGVPPFVPGCSLLMRVHDAMEYGYPFPHDKFIGDIEGDVMRKINAAGLWCASTTESVVDHTGQKQRSWHPGTKKPRTKTINQQ